MTLHNDRGFLSPPRPALQAVAPTASAKGEPPPQKQSKTRNDANNCKKKKKMTTSNRGGKIRKKKGTRWLYTRGPLNMWYERSRQRAITIGKLLFSTVVSGVPWAEAPAFQLPLCSSKESKPEDEHNWQRRAPRWDVPRTTPRKIPEYSRSTYGLGE